MIKSVFTTSDGIDISYTIYNQNGRKNLVFVNGYSASEVTWCQQIEDFERAGYRVLTYDHRSHGLSQKTSRGLTVHRLAMDLRELLIVLDFYPVAAVGHSMGAAVLNAYEELHGENGFLAVVSEDQSPAFLADSLFLTEENKGLSDLIAFLDGFSKIHVTRKKLSEPIKRRLGKGMYPFDFSENRPLLFNVIVQDWRENVKHERVPHLFIAGGLSPFFRPDHARKARELQKNPLSAVEIFDDCGHIPHLESPEKFNERVLKFLNATNA